MRIEYIIKPTFFCLVVPAILFLFAPPSAFAYVKGRCDGCHTMHNSKDNNIVAQKTVAGSIVPSAEFSNLLVSDCVTCHTNTIDGEGKYDLYGFYVPAVYTTAGGGPTSETAGGSFWWTRASGGDRAKGHNVRDISGPDLTIPRAPGAGSVGCAGSCHDSLAKTDATTTPASGSGVKTNGCRGCHLKVGHHARASGEGGDTDGPGDAYRFLSGHDDTIVGIVPNGATDLLPAAYEDPDWEVTKGGNDHNIYQGQTNNPEKRPYISIGRWCAGCHADFHAYGLIEELSGLSGGGDRTDDNPGVNPWLRHPTNVDLPSSAILGVDDYDWNDGSEPYNWNIPLARTGAMNRAPIKSSDQVMCLSCHRAHASEWPDALRWDPTTMDAHTGGPNRVDGCFFCHRTKDD
jgi:predicted CXXCH cytochrome family protein